MAGETVQTAAASSSGVGQEREQGASTSRLQGAPAGGRLPTAKDGPLDRDKSSRGNFSSANFSKEPAQEEFSCTPCEGEGQRRRWTDTVLAFSETARAALEAHLRCARRMEALSGRQRHAERDRGTDTPLGRGRQGAVQELS